jgi:signal transduction histidine kinase
MRWPLRYQILFPFVGVMLAVVVGVSLLDAYLAARRTQRQIEHQLQAVAQTLLDATFPLTDAVLKQTSGLSGAEFVLTDEQGHVRSASRPDVDYSALGASPADKNQIHLANSVDVGGDQYFHAAIDVRPRDGQSGPLALHILYPQRELREARWQAAYPPLLVGGALLGVVIVLAIAIAGRLSRPILELRRELSRLVQGEFRPLAVPQRNDELRDLIGSVNMLGDQLDELRRVIKRSERLSLLGQLRGGLAHQLRNSVTGARIAMQLHQRHCTRVDQDSLTVALRQLAITESHLQRFLSAGQTQPPRRETCDLGQVAGDVVALVTPSCDHRGVRLQLDADCVGAGELSADAELLRQLLLNLVLNAIEAAGSGGWVRIVVSSEPHAATIRVLDSGAGPRHDLVERLFEPFTTGKPEGIGLGLSVAKRIAEAHGGTIRYTRVGATCFEVQLPRAVAVSEPAQPQVWNHASADNTPALKS